MDKLWLVILSSCTLGGKDAVAQWLKESYGFCFLSTGEQYRHQMASDPENGSIIRQCSKTGDLVPNWIHIPIVYKIWPEFVFSGSGKHLGLNGAIRTVGQAEAFVPLIKQISYLYEPVQLFIDTPESECRRRLSVVQNDPNRAGREDDTLEVFENRLRVFRRETIPAIGLMSHLGIRTIRVPVGHDAPKEDVRAQIRYHLKLSMGVGV